MKHSRSALCTVVIAVFVLARAAFGVNYYIDAVNGNDSRTISQAQSSSTPWKTLDKLRTTGVATKGDGDAVETGTTVYISGTFQGNSTGTVINKLKIDPVDNLTIKQWPGMPQAVIRGDIPGATWAGAAGVYTTTLPDADNTTGETDGISDYVASVVYNWDASIDARGRHYGHLQRAASAVACVAGSYLYFYEPTTKLLTVGIGASDSTSLLAWCRGNCMGVEIGTPQYASYPAHNSTPYSAGTLGNYSEPTLNFTLDGVHVYLWCDSGHGNRGASITISTGYCVRIADGVNCVVKNCVTMDSGYHAIMMVGDACYGNLIEDCVLWGGAPNSLSGNSSSGFYSGFLGGEVYANVNKCVARRVTAHKYWHLDVQGCPMILDAERTSMFTKGCDGFIHHTNNRGSTAAGTGGLIDTSYTGDTVTVSGGKFRITTTTSANMRTGERVYIVDSYGLTPSLPAGEYTVTNINSTTIELDGFAASSATNGRCHWYSLSNRVLDVQYEDCKVVESGAYRTYYCTNASWTDATRVITQTGMFRGAWPGQVFILTSATGSTLGEYIVTNATVDSITISKDINAAGGDIASGVTGFLKYERDFGCYGNAFVAGSRCRAPYDETDWKTYPVRFVRCEVVGGSKNSGANTDQAAYYQGRFDMSRAGIAGRLSVGGVFGANSADSNDPATPNRMCFESCEIVYDIASYGDGTPAVAGVVGDVYESRAMFQGSYGVANVGVGGTAERWSGNKLFFYKCSIYDKTNRATGINAMFNGTGYPRSGFVTDDEPWPLTVRQTIMGWKVLRSSGLNYLTYGYQPVWAAGGGTQSRVKGAQFYDNAYFNVSTSSYNPNGGVTEGSSAGQVNTEADWTTDIDTTGVYLGQDASTALKNPFADLEGNTLALSGRLRQLQVYTNPVDGFGFNQRKYDGHYGAWQYGPTEEAYRRILWRR